VSRRGGGGVSTAFIAAYFDNTSTQHLEVETGALEKLRATQHTFECTVNVA
jgi:hypothetical protein